MPADTERIGYWYFGGLASAQAACFTHPLDLIKVHLQADKQAQRGMFGQGVYIYKSNNGGIRGLLSLYNGLSASLGRQLTYSMTRFAAYDTLKAKITNNTRNLTSFEKFYVAFSGGFIGGVVGTPCDLVNVRMQNDTRLPVDQRRNYKHVFDGLIRTYRGEGGRVLMNGYEMASFRAGMMTVGQIAMYEIFKETALEKVGMKDNIVTHFACSCLAGICGVAYTMPLDVMKTKMMNAKPGEFKGVGDAIATTFKQGGPAIFFKGFIPAAIRIMPQTILTWIFKEQLRLNFGYFK